MEAPIPSETKSRRNPILLGCAGLLLLLLIIVATVAGTIWWIQRPIKPVVLSAQERATVEQKIKEIEGGTIPLEGTAPAARPAVPVTDAAAVVSSAPDDRPYVPGSKVLRLTEREVNGLLNQNTDLGETVRLEFARDAIHTYLAILIPQDFPIGAGTVIRMRGRFKVSIGGEGEPYAILEDVTIFGLSLPKEWLGGIKGENLLRDVLSDGTSLQGIKSLKVEPGALVLEVGD
jgi:hypothetical protein